jgi:hypothetical protein
MVCEPPVSRPWLSMALFLSAGGGATAAACGSTPDKLAMAIAADEGGSGGGGVSSDSSSAGEATGIGTGGSGGGTLLFGDASATGAPMTLDPQTCEQATKAHSYVGCDYWPTVLANTVWDIFDFAVVVANAGQSIANVTVTGPSGTNQTASVSSGQLVKLYLPWVPALKGPSANSCGDSPPRSSVLQAGGAFHLVSTVPVSVYQFNALEYQPKGGPAGKAWGSCPGYSQCTDTTSPNYGTTAGCYSFSNDASLLLPSTAMTGNYRVAGHKGVIARRSRQ